MYHPNSLYGKLQKLLDSDSCICNIETKKSGKPFGYNCFQRLININYPSINTLRFGSGTELLEEFDAALSELGYAIPYDENAK